MQTKTNGGFPMNLIDFITQIRRIKLPEYVILLLHLSWISLCAALIFFAIRNPGEERLNKEPIFTKGIVLNTSIGIKSRHYVKYRFTVNGCPYFGNDIYRPENEPLQPKCGDTCEVVYAGSDPNIHKMVRNEDKSLKIKRAF
jgi:hypothetical protein